MESSNTNSPEKKDMTQPFNRALYFMFWLLCFYHVFFRQDYIDGATTLGIALIFDPFDQKVPFNERPLWQRIWLFVHLALAAGLLGFGISVD